MRSLLITATILPAEEEKTWLSGSKKITWKRDSELPTTEGGASTCDVINNMGEIPVTNAEIIRDRRMLNIAHFKTDDHLRDVLNLVVRKLLEAAIDGQEGITASLSFESFAQSFRAFAGLPHVSYHSIGTLIMLAEQLSMRLPPKGKWVRINLEKSSVLYEEYSKHVHTFMTARRLMSSAPHVDAKASWAINEGVPYVIYEVALTLLV